MARRITDALADWDAQAPGPPAAPFAVNQIVHRSNDRLEHDLEICVRHNVPIVITSLGARPEVNEAVHAYGGIVLHDVINDRFARKAVEKGADGLIAVAAGAGGHAGTLSPVRADPGDPRLVRRPDGALRRHRQRRRDARRPGDGRRPRLYRLAPSSPPRRPTPARPTSSPDLEGSAESIVYTNVFTGVHGNYLRASLVAAGSTPTTCPSPTPRR